MARLILLYRVPSLVNVLLNPEKSSESETNRLRNLFMSKNLWLRCVHTCDLCFLASNQLLEIEILFLSVQLNLKALKSNSQQHKLQHPRIHHSIKCIFLSLRFQNRLKRFVFYLCFFIFFVQREYQSTTIMQFHSLVMRHYTSLLQGNSREISHFKSFLFHFYDDFRFLLFLFCF